MAVEAVNVPVEALDPIEHSTVVCRAFLAEGERDPVISGDRLDVLAEGERDPVISGDRLDVLAEGGERPCDQW